jgi:acyl carrier protein
MSDLAIREQVQHIFRIIFDEPELIIKESMSAADVERWTSLTHLNMIHEVEKTFNFKFRLKELMSLKTVDDLLNVIASKKS